MIDNINNNNFEIYFFSMIIIMFIVFLRAFLRDTRTTKSISL